MTSLKIGDKAPKIKGIDQNEEIIQLKNFIGKGIILYFYPKDNTPGCTEQSCNLRDHYSLLLKEGFVVIGVSIDDVKSHQKFQKKFQLPFPLIADTDKKIVNDYKVFGEKQMFGKKYMGILRTTFLIDEKGVIVHIIEKPDTQKHSEEILDFWKTHKKNKNYFKKIKTLIL